MRNYPAIIDRLLERFQLQEINFDDYVACYFFANLRQLLEAEQVTSTYKTIYFYACWSLHPSLDRNIVSQDVLASITSGLPSMTVVDPAFVDVVCENLRAEKLRQEILNLGTHYGFRDVVSDKQRWLQLYGVILNLVTGKPLSPPLKVIAGSNFQIAPDRIQNVQVLSSIRLWLHGNRGQQAEWTVAIVPAGQSFSINNLDGLITFNGGVFAN